MTSATLVPFVEGDGTELEVLSVPSAAFDEWEEDTGSLEMRLDAEYARDRGARGRVRN